ncbi:hypothetical protein [Corynebacterium casei]|uniref:hypothetical protein n=1 Tax=Corynebacterium casei TaxID=160386 RepID=UPI003FD1E06A
MTTTSDLQVQIAAEKNRHAQVIAELEYKAVETEFRALMRQFDTLAYNLPESERKALEISYRRHMVEWLKPNLEDMKKAADDRV